VRVRRQLLPLMETFNPAIVITLARTAAVLHEDAATLDVQAAAALHAAKKCASTPQSACETVNALSLAALNDIPRAILIRVLRLWIIEDQGHARRIETVHLTAIEKLLTGTRGGRIVELPGGVRVMRRKGFLYFLRPTV